jgi:hypothetical protein
MPSEMVTDHVRTAARYFCNLLHGLHFHVSHHHVTHGWRKFDVEAFNPFQPHTLLRRTIVCLYCKINMNSNHVDGLSFPLGQHDNITLSMLEKKCIAAAYQIFYHAHFFAGFVVGTWQGTRTYIISTSQTDSLSFSCSQHDIIHGSENQFFQPRRRLTIIFISMTA